MTARPLPFCAVTNLTKAEIGAWLKAAREAARERAAPRDRAAYAQAGVAERLRVRDRAVRMWEKGRTMPPADQFLDLVLFYGADITTLLRRGRAYKTDLGGGAVKPAARPSGAARTRRAV